MSHSEVGLFFGAKYPPFQGNYVLSCVVNEIFLNIPHAAQRIDKTVKGAVVLLQPDQEATPGVWFVDVGIVFDENDLKEVVGPFQYLTLQEVSFKGDSTINIY